MKRQVSTPDLSVVEALLGPALLLDRDLRIVAATPAVSQLLSFRIPLGERAPKVLCGEGDHRPLAQALARGEAGTTELTLSTPRGDLGVRVHSFPLDPPGGHVLSLRMRPEAGGEQVEQYGIWGRSEAIRSLRREIAAVAGSDASILIRGETGAGKELVARAIHAESARKSGPFRAINCAALPPQLLESELFGHVRGAFTGAIRDAAGQLRMAEGGTFFLDEVAELPLTLQAKLLRVLEERSVLPVGGRDPIPIDVRFVAATHRSLRELVREGQFRADLMYRLRVIPLYLPALRERGDDALLLAERLLSELANKDRKRGNVRLSARAEKAILEYSWPGNVRELQNALEYAFLLGQGGVVLETDLPREVWGELGRKATRPAELHHEDARESRLATSEPIPGVMDSRDQREFERIRRALDRASGHREHAAKSLGISRATLWRKLKKYDLGLGA